MNCKKCNTETSAFPLTCSKCNEPLCDTCHSVFKGECEDCKEPEKEIPETWRRSWITLYDKCPYACYKIAIEGITNLDNIWSKVGNILHDIFEEASNNQDLQVESILNKMFTDQIRILFATTEGNRMIDEAQFLVKGDIVSKMFDRGYSSIKNYLIYEQEAPTPLATEQKYFLDLDGCKKISATVDRVNPLPHDEVELVDYKTGKCFYGKQLSSDLQVPIYIMAYHQATGKLPKRFTFIFVEDGKQRVFERRDDDKYVCTVVKREYIISLQETARYIKRIFARINRDEWSIPDKINSFYCANFCGVAKQGHCAGANDQAWINLGRK